MTVTLVSPVVSVWPERVSANGSIRAWQESIIGNEVGGLQLAEILADVGDHVTKGQVLAQFKDDTVRVDLVQAEAAAAEAEAAEDFTHSQADRTRSLAKSGAVSSDQLQQQLATEKTNVARLASAKARVEAQRLRLRQTRVLAPDDGVISSRTATVGAVLATGSELFRLIRQNRLEWRATVPADRISRVAPGQLVTLHTDGQTPIAGRVRQISPVVDSSTLTGTLYVDLPEPGGLKAGMFASGEIEFGTARALHLPESALVYRDGYQYVMQVDAQRRVRQVKVSAGRRYGQNVEIVQGVGSDDRLVATGGSFLVEGDLVLVAETKTPAVVQSPSLVSEGGRP
ncbi:MAG: efflux RND transporter periplasmic adaptor subunit [Lacunisphaera sp.]|nr:efflux RND transporter periplasmic adaptor subunit [Lacunisphaera sp.]